MLSLHQKDASVFLPLLSSTLIWVSNQTKKETDPLYFTIQPKKMERLCSIYQIKKYNSSILKNWNETAPILVDSPNKYTLRSN